MNVRDLPTHEPTRAILLRDDKRVPSQTRLTDATTALCRGLAEYAAQQKANLIGRDLEFALSHDAQPRAEDLSNFPAFAAFTNETDGTYEAANLGARVRQVRYPDGTWETSGSELAIDVNAEIWANDPEERQALVGMMEDALNPVDWMNGVRLELPHYFNQRATYQLVRVRYTGGSIEALQNLFVARMVLRANVPVTRLLALPEGKPRSRTATVTGGPPLSNGVGPL